MKIFLIFTIAFFTSLLSYSQTNWTIGTYSPDSISETADLGSNHAPIKLVYKIPNELLYSLLDEEKAMAFVKNTIPFDTLDYDTRLSAVLPKGNYIVESAEKNRINYSYEFVANFKVRVYQYKGKHYVMMVTDSMNHILPNAKVFYEGKKEIKYNSGIKGFIIKSNRGLDYDNYLVKVDNQAILLEFDGDKSEYNFKEDYYDSNYGRNRIRYGYLITDKPIYRIGDTLRYKAYVYDKKGKVVNHALNLELQEQYDYDNKMYLDEDISPSSPGVFMGSFVIADTFSLDKNYSLNIGYLSKRKFISVSRSFEVADYQLDKYTLNTRLDKNELFNKGSAELIIQAQDFNGLFIKGARYEIIVTASSIDFYDSINHFVPNPIIKKSGILLSNQPTKIEFKANELLPADATYNIELKTWNSANEMHSRDMYFVNKISPYLELTYSWDTIHYKVHNNNGWKLELEYEDEFDYDTIIKTLPTDSGFVIIDYASFIPGFVLRKGEKTKRRRIDSYGLPYISAYRYGKKLSISNSKGRNIHIKMEVYEGKKLIYQNAGTRLDTVLLTSEKSDILVLSSFYWDGELQTQEYKLGPNLNRYNVEIEIADTVYPGEETTLKIKVSDYAGKAVPNANITAYSVNSEFAYDIPYINIPSGKHIKNRYDNGWDNYLDYPIYFSKSFDITYKKKFNISESQLNYQMRYPKNGLFINELDEQMDLTHSCHFAPFLMENGRIQTVYYVMIDNVPVYLANDAKRAWSFNFVPGIHSIVIRSTDKIYTINNVRLTSGKKTELFLDINNIPDSVSVTEGSKKLTKNEIRMFQNYTKNFDFDEYRNTIVQANTIYEAIGSETFSPFYNESFIRLGNPPTQFTATSKFNSYQIKNNGLVYTDNEKISIANKFKDLPARYPEIGEFSKKLFIEDKQRIEQPLIYDLDKTFADDCELKLIINTDSISYYDVYLVNLDSGRIMSNYSIFYDRSAVYRPEIMDVSSGNYQIIAFTKHNNILVYNAKLKANGLNIINLNNDFEKYISFNNLSRDKKDALISKLFYKDKAKQLDKEKYISVQYDIESVRNAKTVPIYLRDKQSRRMLNRSIIVYNTDTLNSNINAYFSNNIPKMDSTYMLIIDLDGYKKVKFKINPIKEKSDYIIVYLEKEMDALKHYTKSHRRIDTYSRMYQPYGRYFTASHGTVRYLGSETKQVVRYNVPLIEKDQTSTGGMRGARDGGVATYIDGVRVIGNSSMPRCAISQVEYLDDMELSDIAVTVGGVYSIEDSILDIKSGGTPAMYGDVGPILEFISRSNFKDVGFWVPNLVTDENGEAEVQIKFPDNITSWTAQVIAAGSQRKAGVAVKTIIATKNQLARIETPRFLTQGDSCLINTKLINYEAKPLVLKDYFKLNGELQTSKKLKLDSFITKQQLLVVDTTNQIVEYGFTAKGGIQDAEQRIIKVLPQGAWHSEGEFFVLDGDTSITISAQDKEVKLVVYQDLLEVMLSDIEQVKTYKYDCNEQKASKLIALLLQEQIDNYLGIKFKDKRKIKRLIKSLEQTNNGPLNWGWWPDTKSINWISNHVVYALMMADNQDYQTSITYQYINLEDSRSDNAQMRYIRSQFEEWKQSPVSINWNRKFKSVEDQLWNLKAKMAYNMTVSVKDVLALSHSTLKGGLYWGENNYSRIENKVLCTSLAFELIREIDSTNTALDRALLYLLSHHGFDKMNTYETAYMTNAIVPYLLAPNSKLPKSTISDKLGTALSFDQEIVIKPGESFTLNKKGNSKVFAMQYSRYFEAQPTPVDSLFKVQVQYFIDDSLVTSFTAGDQVIMKLNVVAKKQADFAMIEIPLPASCTYSSNEAFENSVEVHREKYKEKLIIYCESLPEGSTTFQVELQARFPGTFNVNPASVKEMYYPFFFGRNGIERVRVESK
jgi:hypothetical protein